MKDKTCKQTYEIKTEKYLKDIKKYTIDQYNR